MTMRTKVTTYLLPLPRLEHRSSTTLLHTCVFVLQLYLTPRLPNVLCFCAYHDAHSDVYDRCLLGTKGTVGHVQFTAYVARGLQPGSDPYVAPPILLSPVWEIL